MGSTLAFKWIHRDNGMWEEGGGAGTCKSDQQSSSAQIGPDHDVLNVPKDLLHSLLVGGASDVAEDDSILIVVDLHEGVLDELDGGLVAAVEMLVVLELIARDRVVVVLL